MASPRRPPKVIIGAKQAKYKKITEAIDCNAKASLKSLKYQGVLRLMSLMRPPNHLHVKGNFFQLVIKLNHLEKERLMI